MAYPGEVLARCPHHPERAALRRGRRRVGQRVQPLLAGATKRALLNVDVTELNCQPLTLKALFDLVGAGGLIAQDRPVAISLRPEVAPIVTTAPGPAGSTGELAFSGYRTTIRTADDTNAVLLELVLDFRTGIGLELVDGGLGFTFAQPAEEDMTATISKNRWGYPKNWWRGLPALSRRCSARSRTWLPRFPLPQFAGLDLSWSRSTGSARASCSSPTFCRRRRPSAPGAPTASLRCGMRNAATPATVAHFGGDADSDTHPGAAPRASAGRSPSTVHGDLSS